jgi:D-psicose/D-tagatose/L-ribulose 3-epimerase
MKLGLISSAWLGTHVDTEAGIRLTKEIGFDSIDIFADPLEISATERRSIRRACNDAGLPVISLPCCALGIADFNTPVRKFHATRARAYLDFCCELDARNLLLVLGEYIWQQEVIPPRDQWRWAVEEVHALGEYAAAMNLEVALELEPFHLSIVNSVAKMDEFLRDVALPAVKANVDISHLVLAHDPPEALQKLAHRIAHAHLSDCNGRTHGDLPPGRGCVDFPAYFAALRDTGFNGTVSIELEYSPEPEKIVDWVREAYVSSDKLMRGAGVRA